MTSLKDFLYKVGNQSEHFLDDLKLKFRERMGWETIVHITPYTSFGNRSFLYVKGRVIHDRGIHTEHDDSFFENLVNMYLRLNSHEIKEAKLKVSYQGKSYEVISDDDGYFSLEFPYNSHARLRDGWHHPEIELLESPIPFDKPVKMKANVLVPPSSAAFGIISDIDDTIVKTDATRLLKMAWNTFAGNAHTREAFVGVSAFYRALHRGGSGKESNPVFYVSSSPWNLYDLLTDFMLLNKIPPGPLFLKDYGFTQNKIFSEGHTEHKLKKIKKVMDAIPHLPFILIGDSGQKDPEVYAEVVKGYPNRVLAVYIRDVSQDERDHVVRSIYDHHPVEMILSADCITTANHAASKGFISSDSMNQILESVQSISKEGHE